MTIFWGFIWPPRNTLLGSGFRLQLLIHKQYILVFQGLLQGSNWVCLVGIVRLGLASVYSRFCSLGTT